MIYLQHRWDNRCLKRRNERRLTIDVDGLALGRTLLAKWADGALVINERRIKSLLFVAYQRPIAPDVISKIRSAEKAYKRGDIVIALLHLAHTGLHMIDEFDTPLRLFKAEMLLRRGFTAKELLKIAGLAKDDSDEEEDDEDEDEDGNEESGDEENEGDSDSDPSGDNSDFNSKHPRWPAGSPGGIGGEFAPKDEGEATQALHDGIAADAQAATSGSNAPTAIDPARAIAILTSGLDNPKPLPAGSVLVAADEGIQSDALPQSITTANGLEIQDVSQLAQEALTSVRNGAPVYRVGQFGESMAWESQYWSLENPFTTPGYANSMGMPEVLPDFVLKGTVNANASVVTNIASPIGVNSGGGIQVITSPNGVNAISLTSVNTTPAPDAVPEVGIEGIGMGGGGATRIDDIMFPGHGIPGFGRYDPED